MWAWHHVSDKKTQTKKESMFKLLNMLLYKQLGDRQTQTGNVTYVLIGAKNINWMFAIWVQIFLEKLVSLLQK